MGKGLRKIVDICLVTAIALGVFFVSGCETEKETKQAPPKPRVVSKTISQPQEKAAPATDAGMLKENKVPAASRAAGAGSKQDSPQAEETKTVQAPKPDTAKPVTEDQARQEQKLASASGPGVLFQTQEKYDTKGRVDPFVPLIREKAAGPEPGAEGKEKPARPQRMLTPLERMDLSQIKLVAVIKMGNQSMAMVEEASGKGYEVRIGTYMGRNGGRVSAIGKNGLMVKEYYRDYQGKRRERIQEIKFHRNEDGE